MDEALDRDTLLLVENTRGGAFVTISVEDLIAEPMGQYASGSAPGRLDQARTLFRLQPSLDRAYLGRRIREEAAGDYGIEDLDKG